jgi:hypothetical protein
MLQARALGTGTCRAAHVGPALRAARPHAAPARRRAAAAGKDGAAGLSEEALKDVVAKLAAAEAEAAQLRDELAAKEARRRLRLLRVSVAAPPAPLTRRRYAPARWRRWAASRRTSWRG